MITNIDFFKDAEEENDKKYVEDITKKLIEKDNELFKMTKENPEYQKYKIKEKRNKTIITKRCRVTIPRRRYYYFDEILKRKVYVFLLDEYLEIKKWQRTENSLREKILSFMGDGKRYGDVIDTVVDSKVSNMTISNIYKNADLDKIDYIHINQSNKIDITEDTLYVQMDGTFQTMRDDKTKEKLKEHILVSVIHTGFDKEKSTEKRPVIENKLGVIELDNIPEYIRKNSKLTNFVSKLLILITSYYDINDNIEIMVLGDGVPWIKNIAKFIQEYFPKNKLHYTIDKFHLTSRFKKLYPFQNKNKENRETYHKTVDYFYNAKYEELLQCLEDSKSFISDAKLDFLNKTIRLIKNNEEGVRNQTLWNNIGCHVEGDISNYCKGILVKKATYHEKTLKNKLNTSMMNFKNKINLFNTKPLEENKINYLVNNFNKNLQQNLYLY